MRWAAKEAGFKVVTKLLGSPPPFEHRAFRVRVAEVGVAEAGPSRPVRATVTYRDREIPVRGEVDDERVHVLARASGEDDAGGSPQWRVLRLDAPLGRADDGWEDGLRDRFTEREWRSIHRPVSARVRLEARAELARSLGVPEGEVEIVCDEGPPGRMPPRVLVGGAECAGDLTLSHHGRFLAWAFVVPEEGPR